MQVAGMLLGCLLLGSGWGSGHPVRPAEVVAEAMLLPVGSNITGQPMTLLATLGSTSDRGQQLQIVRAYWRLTQAVADYHFCLDQAKTLERIKLSGRSDALLRAAESSATAQLREAEVAATRLQYELAELAHQPAGSSLPLPSDRPLVEPYRTSFKELFANRTPPEAARLAERVLPIQRQTIVDRAAAIQAADDALAAAVDDLQSGRGSTAAVAACSRELLQQQRAFIASVCGYNRNIADYALTVVGTGISAEQLVAILIGAPQQPGGSSPPGNSSPPDKRPTTNNDRPVRSTSAEEPITDNPMRQPGRNEPTPAPPRSRYEPTPAPPRGTWRSGDTTPPSPDTPPRRTSGDALERPTVSIDSLPPPSPATLRATNKPFGPGAEGGVASPLYQALVSAQPGARAKQLTIALHWDRSLPDDAGKAINLADCLMRDGSTNRRATIEAFWLVRQRAAQYQVLAEQAELLESLSSVVLEHRNDPSGATDMLRLRAAQLATRAMIDEAHTALVEAQYALALRIGAVADADWPLASTTPHSGSYLLKLDAQPRSVAESWPVQRLAATMPALGENVQQRAAAVVDADVARVTAAERYVAGAAGFDPLLGSILDQSEQTSAFLESLTAYNRAIAEYATTVLPPGLPAAKLVTALVAKP